MTVSRPVSLVFAVLLAVFPVLLPVRLTAQEEAGPPKKAGAEKDPVAAATAAVERARRAMEDAFLRIRADHAKVRGDEFAVVPMRKRVAEVIEIFIDTVRSEKTGRSEKAGSDAGTADWIDSADRVVASLADAVGEALMPLSREGMTVVLAHAAVLARKDPAVAAVDVVAGAAREVFRADDAADTWDAHCRQLPVVRAFRQAGRDLAEARKSAGSGDKTPGGKPSGPAVDPAAIEQDMVLLPRAKSRVGPWRGWVGDIEAKSNVRKRFTFKGLYVDRYEVTCDRYLAFLLAEPAKRRAGLLPEGWRLDVDDVPAHPTGKARHPVTGVTFEQAHRFAKFTGKRLPTEDEWEHVAASGGKSPRRFPWGDDPTDTSFAHRGAKLRDTVAVDAYPQDTTAEGVVGLAGNVAEMVATTADRRAVPRGKPPKGAKITIRGGTYRSKAAECATWWRWVVEPDKAAAHIGFRCVMGVREYRRRFGE